MALTEAQKTLLAVASTAGKIRPQEIHNDFWQIIKQGGSAGKSIAISNDLDNARYKFDLKDADGTILNSAYLGHDTITISDNQISIKDGFGNVTTTITLPASTTDQAGIVQLQDTIADGVTTKAATPNAVYDYINTTLKAKANGLASLDASGKVPVGQLPETAINGMEFKGVIGSQADYDAFVGVLQEGDYFIATATVTLTLNSIETTLQGRDEHGTLVTSLTLQTGDWLVVTWEASAGPSGDIVFAVLNNNATNLYTPKRHGDTSQHNGTEHTAASTTVAGFMSAADKVRLNGMADNANNYTHPTSHAPSIITQDASNRFVTDAEKTTWNAKASTAVATTSANGLMSATDKTKLDGIAASAEVNQNAISNITVGGTTVQAASKTDTITMAANGFAGVTANASTKTVTVSATMSQYRIALAAASTTVTVTGWTKKTTDAVMLFQNGILLAQGSGLDYTLGSNNVITLTKSAEIGTEFIVIVFSY